MDTSKLDVLGDGVGHDLAVAGHGVHLDLLGVLDKLRHHDGMVLADVGSQLEEALELIVVGADIHGSARKDVARTHEEREADTGHKLINVLHARQRTPLGLVDTALGEHLRELGTVLGIVDVLCRRTQDGHVHRVEVHGKVVGDLTTRGDDRAVRTLQVEDIHHALEGELVEVETVAHIVVCGDGLGVVVDHDGAVALATDGLQGLDATPVKLHGTTDTVGARSEHDDGSCGRYGSPRPTSCRRR